MQRAGSTIPVSPVTSPVASPWARTIEFVGAADLADELPDLEAEAEIGGGRVLLMDPDGVGVDQLAGDAEDVVGDVGARGVGAARGVGGVGEADEGAARPRRRR